MIILDFPIFAFLTPFLSHLPSDPSFPSSLRFIVPSLLPVLNYLLLLPHPIPQPHFRLCNLATTPSHLSGKASWILTHKISGEIHLLFLSEFKKINPQSHILTRAGNNMAEEQRCQTSEGHRLCANNCGFFGSPATMNLCSKCYRDFCLKEEQQAATRSTIENVLSSSSAPAPPPAMESLPPPQESKAPDVAVDASISAPSSAVPDGKVAQPNRCATCCKRVGFTGFKCKCGITFCGVHRYPEKHGCSFDFKAVGREEISRANPVVVAEKLRRI